MPRMRGSEEEAMMKRNSKAVTCIIGMAISGSVLVLLIPALFRPESQSNIWIPVVLGCLFLVFAAGARHWKPSLLNTDVDR